MILILYFFLSLAFARHAVFKEKLEELEANGETLESFAAKDAEKNSVFDKENEDWKWTLEEEMNKKDIKKEVTNCKAKVLK